MEILQKALFVKLSYFGGIIRAILILSKGWSIIADDIPAKYPYTPAFYMNKLKYYKKSLNHCLYYQIIILSCWIMPANIYYSFIQYQILRSEDIIDSELERTNGDIEYDEWR